MTTKVTSNGRQDRLPRQHTTPPTRSGCTALPMMYALIGTGVTYKGTEPDTQHLCGFSVGVQGLFELTILVSNEKLAYLALFKAMQGYMRATILCEPNMTAWRTVRCWLAPDCVRAAGLLLHLPSSPSLRASEQRQQQCRSLKRRRPVNLFSSFA